ncbi:MAG TPA: protease inhibitor I42 family protein [Anaerolineales bacterium]|nr:protease inhibitor I42 family protein [Anaerolineales bacterium]
MKKIFPFLLLAVLLAACSSGSTEPTDPSKTIEASAGRGFKIIIESNPTTGYHWEMMQDSTDENVVKFMSKEYKSTSEPGTVGGGGVDIWTFKAVNPGETKIVLGYYPPSNTPTDPERTETFRLSVK